MEKNKAVVYWSFQPPLLRGCDMAVYHANTKKLDRESLVTLVYQLESEIGLPSGIPSRWNSQYMDKEGLRRVAIAKNEQERELTIFIDWYCETRKEYPTNAKIAAYLGVSENRVMTLKRLIRNRSLYLNRGIA